MAVRFYSRAERNISRPIFICLMNLGVICMTDKDIEQNIDQDNVEDTEATVNYDDMTTETETLNPFVRVLHKPYEYFPSSIIYAIENPCVIRSELVDCNQENNVLTKFILGRNGE